MNFLEKFCFSLRHSKLLKNSRIWNVLRPLYDSIVLRIGRKGLPRIINGVDHVLIHPIFRNLGEVYEPDVWTHLMENVQKGDKIADVGAYIGLYSVALAKRVGQGGQVYAFEPSLENFSWLKTHTQINSVDKIVCPINSAVGDSNGNISFSVGKGIQNQIVPEGTKDSNSVPLVCLDNYFSDSGLDILKIDVEGFEEGVLRGSRRILRHQERPPRIIYIEVHPYNWHLCGTSSSSILDELRDSGYYVFFLDGKPVESITQYGEIIAKKMHT